MTIIKALDAQPSVEMVDKGTRRLLLTYVSLVPQRGGTARRPSCARLAYLYVRGRLG